MPKNHHKRKGRKGGAPREMVVVDPADRFDDMLAVHTDSCNIKGKEFFSITVSASTNIVPVTIIAPQNFAGRPAQIAALFARWRLKYMNIRVYSGASTANQTNAVAIGVMDDASGAEGDAPTSLNGLMALRTSKFIPTGLGPQSREFKPLTTEWYYTFPGSSGSEPRLVVCGIIYVGASVNTTATVDVELDYSFAFKGAIDVGANLSIPLPLTTRPAFNDLPDDESAFVVVADRTSVVPGVPGNARLGAVNNQVRNPRAR